MDSIRIALACIGRRAARSHGGEVFEDSFGDYSGENVLSRGCRAVVRIADRCFTCIVQSIAYILRSRLLYMQIQGSLQSEVKR